MIDREMLPRWLFETFDRRPIKWVDASQTYWQEMADEIKALLGGGEPVGYVDKAEMELLTADLTPTVHLWRYPGDEEDGVPIYLALQRNEERTMSDPRTKAERTRAVLKRLCLACEDGTIRCAYVSSGAGQDGDCDCIHCRIYFEAAAILRGDDD